MLRRRRKQKVTWFPLLGSRQSEEVFAGDSSWGRDIVLAVLPDGGPNIATFPMVWDAPREPDTQTGDTTPLVDFVGNEYSLRRIVGNIFVQASSATGSNGSLFNILVTAGLFVARAADTKSAPSGVDTPIGFTGNPADDAPLYSPDHISTAREPWIWRRKWLVTNPMSTDAASGQFPYTNISGYGASVMESSFVDSKISRRIGNDDRLWLSIIVRSWPLFEVYTAPTTEDRIATHVDLRVLGTLRKARNHSTF